MPKSYSSKYVVKILEGKGFVFKSKKGSHAKYSKGNKIVIVPHPKKDIPGGTFRSILRQSGLKQEDFYQ